MSKNSADHDKPENHLVVFQEKAIRRTWHNEEWWFSVIDVVGVLSESNNPNRYWSDLKRKLAQEAGSEQLYEKIVRLKLAAPDGKQRETDCAKRKPCSASSNLSLRPMPSRLNAGWRRWVMSG